jgi:hypothetical protein
MGKSKAWTIVAVVIIGLVVAFGVQRFVLDKPSPYQTRVNEFMTKGGLTAEGASFLASTKLELASSNKTFVDFLLTFPTNSTVDVVIRLSPNKTFVVTQEAAKSQLSNGVYQAKFMHYNTSEGMRFDLDYFIPDSSISTRQLSIASSQDLSIFLIEIGLPQAIGLGHFAPLNVGVGTAAVGTGVHVSSTFHGLEGGKGAIEAAKGIQEAISTSLAYRHWVSELNDLRDCAENPTNPVTIKGYEDDPGQKGRIIQAIDNAMSELKQMTTMRFVTTEVSLGTELVGILALDVVAVAATHYSDSTLEKLSEELVKSVEGMVTPCDKKTTSTNSQTRSASTETIRGDTQVSVTGITDARYVASTDTTTSDSYWNVKDEGGITLALRADGSVKGTGGGHISLKGYSPTGESGGCTSTGETNYAFSVSGFYLPNVGNVTFSADRTTISPFFMTLRVVCDYVFDGQPVHSDDSAPFPTAGPLIPEHGEAVTVRLEVGATAEEFLSLNLSGAQTVLDAKLTIVSVSTTTTSTTTRSSSSSSSSTTLSCSTGSTTSSATSKSVTCTLGSTSAVLGPGMNGLRTGGLDAADLMMVLAFVVVGSGFAFLRAKYGAR